MSHPSSRTPENGLGGSIFAVGMLSFLGLLLETVVTVLFPALMDAFDIGMSAVQWMTSGYLLIVSVIMPLSGYLQRRFTVRALFLSAAAGVIAGALVAALAPSYPVLLIGRLLQGVGTGIATPLMFTTILTRSPRHQVGKLMGIGALTLGVAPTLGPTIGGIIGTSGNWRLIFWGVIPLALVALVVGLRSLRQVTPVVREPLSAVQLVLLAVGMVGLVMGVDRAGAAFTAASASAATWILPIALLVIGALALAAFARTALRAAAQDGHPLIYLEILRNRGFAGGLVAFTLLQFGTVGLGYLMPNFTQLGLGESVLAAGLVGLPGAVIGAVFAPLGGAILDKFGARTPIMIGAGVALLGALALALMGTRFGLVGLMAGHFIYMFGFGLAFANTQTASMGHVAQRFTADGTALMNTAQQFAGALSTTVLSTILATSQFGLTSGSAAYRSATTGGTMAGFILVAFMVLGAVCAEWVSFSGAPRSEESSIAPDEEIATADAQLSGASR